MQASNGWGRKTCSRLRLWLRSSDLASYNVIYIYIYIYTCLYITECLLSEIRSLRVASSGSIAIKLPCPVFANLTPLTRSWATYGWLAMDLPSQMLWIVLKDGICLSLRHWKEKCLEHMELIRLSLKHVLASSPSLLTLVTPLFPIWLCALMWKCIYIYIYISRRCHENWNGVLSVSFC